MAAAMIKPGDSNDPSRPGAPIHLEADDLPAPPLPGEKLVRRSADEVIDALAADIVVESLRCVRRFGDFHLALSGGSTPQPLYERLMICPTCRSLPWQNAHVWIVDERCVPFDDERSNFRMIRETIVEHSDIPPQQVHPIPAMSRNADLEYEKTIRETLCWREKHEDRLDLVLLGMGPDGHTASLFPHTEALHETKRLVVFNEAKAPPLVQRVTMTYPLINSARFIAVLVTGASKAATIQRMVSGHDTPEDMPIKGVRPVNGTLRWYLDAAACGL
jgi:6-phosphogluconolactonase